MMKKKTMKNLKIRASAMKMKMTAFQIARTSMVMAWDSYQSSMIAMMTS